LSGLRGNFSVITRQEIVAYLLRESGQLKRDSVNHEDVVRFLKLEYAKLNFNLELGQENFPQGITPRALLSFPDKVIATDDGLKGPREKFSIFHEVGHYVLPEHQGSLYVCDPNDSDISRKPTWRLESEANEFAAELLFMGDRFVTEANSVSLSAQTVKELADKYEASFEATARRLVEKRIRPCMLVVFKKGTNRLSAGSASNSEWQVHYCVSSASFSSRYFTEQLSGSPPENIISVITMVRKDIADSVKDELCVLLPNGRSYSFAAEYFYNQYNIFCFLSEPTS
jgi:hypothetical protein